MSVCESMISAFLCLTETTATCATTFAITATFATFTTTATFATIATIATNATFATIATTATTATTIPLSPPPSPYHHHLLILPQLPLCQGLCRIFSSGGNPLPPPLCTALILYKMCHRNAPRFIILIMYINLKF